MLTSTDDRDLCDRLLREADQAALLLDSIGGDAVVSAILTMGRISLLTARTTRSDVGTHAALLDRLDGDAARSSAPGALDCSMRWFDSTSLQRVLETVARRLDAAAAGDHYRVR